ncbi:sialidase family protein [Ferriphaselus sp. R-1]|uniref:sialidase family protein n=1 Tax=Ferriphaselus sp. R-1 TaxID=1485544 RepID=UPI000558C467|nr:sialidase family protein [Ferriphaselus sp. R-1]
MRRNRALLILLAVAFGAAFLKAGSFPGVAAFVPAPATHIAATTAHVESRFASSKLHTQVHAASAIELKDGTVRAFWFSGSREGAADVTIHSAVFDPQLGRWGKETVVASRESTQHGLHRYVSKVGNPVPARTADGRLWLYYVTVSLGGWAGSSITAISSDDEGLSWSAPRRLITSPFANISTLVKGAPFLYADGTLGLPVYHESFSKFAELLRLDRHGTVIDKQRLAAGGQGSLQPVLLVQDAQRATVLTRYSGSEAPRRARTMSTQDGGQHWSAPVASALPNPDAALSAVVLADGRWLAALNNQQAGRDSLSLMLSADQGASWRVVQVLEDQRGQAAACEPRIDAALRQSDLAVAHAAPEVYAGYRDSARVKVQSGGACNFEFSYPYLIQTRAGDFHLLYTWNRVFIKHLHFDTAWIEQRLREAAP